MRSGDEIDYRAFVDAEKGTVDRRIFSDQEIYDMEMERIFARAWNFMCHESQIAKPGDFFLNFIGEESVIATRDKKGNLQVLLNTCRHRGNAVCRAEQGRATSFLCTYHGWTYDLEGRLVGVPGYKDFYHEALDREQWGLPKAAKVQSYRGFVFATMDPEAPDLEEYLGPVGRHGMDLIAERGNLIAFDGVQKNLIGCNWKMAVDNLYDWYHVQISHASAMMTLFAAPPPDDGTPKIEMESPLVHRVAMGEYGHAIGGPRLTEGDWAMLTEKYAEIPNAIPYMHHGWRGRPETAERFGPTKGMTIGHPNIFPNLWVASGGSQLSLRLPKGPGQCEIWWFTFREEGMGEEIDRVRSKYAITVFGPAGMLEQEDGENWDQSTRATGGVLAQRYPLNFSMNLGRSTVQNVDGFTYVDTAVNEHAQLWTWRSWTDWMSAETWDDLKANHTRVPAEV